MILDNKISMGHARVLSKMENTTDIEKYAREIIDTNMSVRDLEKVTMSSDVKKKVPMARETKSSDYELVEAELKEQLGTKVRISNKKIEIYFENVNDLNRILEILDIKID